MQTQLHKVRRLTGLWARPAKCVSRHLFVFTATVSALLLAACDPATPTPGPTRIPSITPTSAAAAARTAAVTPVPQQATNAAGTATPGAVLADTASADVLGIGLQVPPSVAQGFAVRLVSATPKGDGPAFGGATPEHVLVLFDGEQPNTAALQRNIRIYPAAGWRAIDPALSQQIDKLTDLLGQRPATVEGELPFLPVQHAGQVFHTPPKYIDFANGRGMRFLTAYAQDITPITNENIFYAFQGLSQDGLFYISAVFPLRSIMLPNTFADSLAAQDPAGFEKDYARYLSEIAKSLNELPTDQFAPDLAQLDAMLATLNAEPQLEASAADPSAKATPATTPVTTTDVPTPAPTAEAKATLAPRAAATKTESTDAAAGVGITAEAAKPVGVARVRNLVNVRQGPSTRTAVVAQLRRNAEVQLLGRDARTLWIFVQLADGKKGWINASFLRSGMRLRDLPLIQQ